MPNLRRARRCWPLLARRLSILLGDLAFSPARQDKDAPAAQIAFVTDDMDADWQRAVSAGAIVVKVPEAKPWGQTTGYLRDLNGHIVEFCTRSPRDR